MRYTRFLALGLVLGAGSVAAEDRQSEDLPLGSLTLQLVTTEAVSQTLMLGDQVLLIEDRILPGEQMAIGDAFVRVLNVGSGGSVCSGALRILSERGGKIDLSEATDPCLYPEVAPLDGALELRVRPLPAQPGQRWRWSADAGLTTLPDQEFAPEPGQTWALFDAVQNSHPINVLSFAPIYAQFKAELSEAEFTSLALMLAELGSGSANAQGYAGETCAKWECDTRFAYLWVDKSSERAFAFWREDAQEFASPLPLESWPQWVVLRAAEALAARQ